LILLGGLLHAAILLPPLAWCGRLGDPLAWWFLVLASATYLADATSVAPSVAPQQIPVGGRAARLGALATGLTLLALFWSALATGCGDGRAFLGVAQGAGAALMLAGALLRGAAIRRLGSFFVTEPWVAAEQPLVTDGIYRWVRHPSETGLLATGLGAGVFCESLPALAFWAAGLVPLVLVRLRLEERVLLAGFGEQYREYARRTPALLPKLWCECDGRLDP
jgi:protein-S-isoprenylcysteine O-methyltransferase Ste14